MNILENLEQLTVSEECFEDILGIVEKFLGEGANLLKLINRAEKKYRDNALGTPLSQKQFKNHIKLHKIFKDEKHVENLKDKTLEIPNSQSYPKRVSGNASSSKLLNLTNQDRGTEETRALDTERSGVDAGTRQVNKAWGRHLRAHKN